MSTALQFDPIRLSKECEELRQEVRAFIKQEIAAGTFNPNRTDSDDAFNSEFSRKVGAKGWIGMTWPKKYGGHERTFLERYVVTEEFRVANAPVLAHIISSILLAGIGDALSGEGLRFTSLVGGYTYQANRITLREWHAFGVSTGITAAGTIDLGADRLDLSGMVVPGNALNGLLNNVPVLGELLGGRGGGLLAANYRVRGSLADPQVNIDVLSILALGQLRNLIRGSDQGATAPPQQAQEPDVPPTSR